MDVLSGKIWGDCGFSDGYVVVENGIVTETGEGKPPCEPILSGYILPGVVDGHTHVADAGLILDRKYGLEELVAPPNGLKHRYLNGTDDGTLSKNMSAYTEKLISGGVSRFIDFRENGLKGCRLLRDSSDDAVILGRPVSKEFDVNEIDDILDVADGIGIPSITDMDHRYIESIAQEVHKKKKILALHVSERIREDIGFVLSLSPTFVVHMVKATDRDMIDCAENNVPAVVCARSNLYFGTTPPIGRMLDSDMTVAVGTDNAMISTPDIFGETKVFADILAHQGKGPTRALACLVAGGKKIIYEECTIGVQTGERADLVVIPDLSGDKPFMWKTDGIVRYRM